jgi:excisionase family DNA binding protein
MTKEERAHEREAELTKLRDDPDRLLTIEQAAIILNCNRRTLARRVKSGELACIRIGRRPRFHRRHLDEYVRKMSAR